MKPTGLCPYCKKDDWADEPLKFKLEPESGESFPVISCFCKNCGYMMFARKDVYES